MFNNLLSKMNQFQMVPRSASKLMGKLFPRSAANGVQWN